NSVRRASLVSPRCRISAQMSQYPSSRSMVKRGDTALMPHLVQSCGRNAARRRKVLLCSSRSMRSASSSDVSSVAGPLRRACRSITWETADLSPRLMTRSTPGLTSRKNGLAGRLTSASSAGNASVTAGFGASFSRALDSAFAAFPVFGAFAGLAAVSTGAAFFAFAGAGAGFSAAFFLTGALAAGFAAVFFAAALAGAAVFLAAVLTAAFAAVFFAAALAGAAFFLTGALAAGFAVAFFAAGFAGLDVVFTATFFFAAALAGAAVFFLAGVFFFTVGSRRRSARRLSCLCESCPARRASAPSASGLFGFRDRDVEDRVALFD